MNTGRTSDLRQRVEQLSRDLEAMKRAQRAVSGDGEVVLSGKRLVVDRSVHMSDLMDRLNAIEGGLTPAAGGGHDHAPNADGNYPNGAVVDHGGLSGLEDDDHVQYLLASAATDREKFAAHWEDLTDGGGTTLHTHAHNNMSDMDGGTPGEYYHVTAAQYAQLATIGDLSASQGDLLVGDATPEWTILLPGSNGQFLKMASGMPTWAAHGLTYSDVGADAAGTAAGLISTHESSYNHANYDTAYGWGDHALGGYLKADGTVPLTADWDAGAYTITCGHLKLDDAGGDHHLTIDVNSDLNADYSLYLYTGNANRILNIGGNAYISQNYTTTGTPQFGRLGLGAAADGTASLLLSAVANAGEDTDKFLVLDSGGRVDYRTGAEVLSDIGAVAGAHTHDGDTLQLDGVNSDGGAFSFTTTGQVTFNQNISVPSIYVDGYIYNTGDADTYIGAGADQWFFRAGGVLFLNLTEDAQDVFDVNPGEVDIDTTIHWDSGVAQFWEGSSGYTMVGAGNAPEALLHVFGGDATVAPVAGTNLFVEDSDDCFIGVTCGTDKQGGIVFASTEDNSALVCAIEWNLATPQWEWRVGGAAGSLYYAMALSGIHTWYGYGFFADSPVAIGTTSVKTASLYVEDLSVANLLWLYRANSDDAAPAGAQELVIESNTSLGMSLLGVPGSTATIFAGLDTADGYLSWTSGGSGNAQMTVQLAAWAWAGLTLYSGPDTTGWVLNEAGNDYDGRIEGDTDTHLAFFDAGADKVCISTDTPLAAKLTVVQDDASGESCISLKQDDVSEGFGDCVGSDRGVVATTAYNSVASMRWELNGSIYVIPLFPDQ